jgi:predicted pyridoxine 5'-phosphate oxidase superfamily flavin-nucleotide-binding protein
VSAPGWPGPASPLHAGERFLQERVGLADRMERAAWKMIRPAMPDQHRELFEKLPYLVLGGLDARRRPWATVVAGAPGFVRSPDDRTLVVGALPGDGDALAAALVPGAPVAVLGIELATRRRNRANGTVVARDGAGFALEVRQSFGNCPQYIQARVPLEAGGAAGPGVAASAGQVAGIVRNADTLFIASATPDAGHGDGSDGVDVSHRGGRPDFVAVDGDRLTLPDYAGNNLFNTLGNLLREPHAGLVFVEFATGALLTVSGRTELVWDGPEVAEFPGAERLVRLHVEDARYLPGRVPARWSPPVPAREVATL